MLLEAFTLLLKMRNDVKLLIIGPDDGYLDQMNKLIDILRVREKIIIAGYISNKKTILSAFIDSDIFVLPSVYDMFPTTVLEAWACGTPVIVSEESGIADFVGSAGIVVKREPNELSKAILRILNDETLAKRLRINGKNLVREKFSWERVANKFETVYSNVSILSKIK